MIQPNDLESQPDETNKLAGETTESQRIQQLSQFMLIDNDHVVFRRFARLHLYNLLYLQHRLIALDEKVMQYEDITLRNAYKHVAGILPELSPLLKEYGEALLLQDQLMRLPPPRKHLLDHFQDLALSEVSALAYELNKPSGWADLVSLAATDKGLIHKLIDKYWLLRKPFLKEPIKGYSSQFLLYNEQRVRRAEQAFINFAFWILVLAPIFALSYLSNKNAKLLIIAGATFAASFIASFLSNHAQKSSLAVMAGYTAILVVFLGGNIGV